MPDLANEQDRQGRTGVPGLINGRRPGAIKQLLSPACGNHGPDIVPLIRVCAKTRHAVVLKTVSLAT